MEKTVYRSRTEIERSILESCVEVSTKTNLMYGARLSYSQLISYLPRLVQSGLISKRNNHFVISEKGKQYLEQITKLSSLVN